MNCSPAFKALPGFSAKEDNAGKGLYPCKVNVDASVAQGETPEQPMIKGY